MFIMDGFIRLCAATPELKVADCRHNRAQIEQLLTNASGRNAAAVVFPELCMTGSTCGGLFGTHTLLREAENELALLLKNTAALPVLGVVGVPVACGSAVYNCSAVFFMGKLLALCAKEELPAEALRNFSSAPAETRMVTYAEQAVPLGNKFIFDCDNIPGLSLAVASADGTQDTAAKLAKNGAAVLLCPAANAETVGKAEYRRLQYTAVSARLLSAFVCAEAGTGESTTDLVFAGHRMICENGKLLAESPLFSTGLTEADVDLELLAHERRRMNTWPNAADSDVPRISFAYPADAFVGFETTRVAPVSPFIPENESELSARCASILTMQAMGLVSRMKHIHGKHAVLGLSGGLDSTLALLVTAEAFDILGLPRSGIHAVSMPGFGTTGRTKGNAQVLAEELGTDFREISIHKAVNQHFLDIHQDPENHDVTYENAQARERTQLLMDIANQNGGIVIGTGDLSELALGWATYNGDHMSMYGVNAAIPKTLVRHLVRYKAGVSAPKVAAVLLDILDTPVSPELLPPVDGVIAQKTEELVGPYELHDFFLYYTLRYGFAPGKIYRMACRTFAGTFDTATIKKWLATFFRRFFQQQFKRSCLPDGPKVGSVGLSPRGDFHMHSDASARLWLEEIETL